MKEIKYGNKSATLHPEIRISVVSSYIPDFALHCISQKIEFCKGNWKFLRVDITKKHHETSTLTVTADTNYIGKSGINNVIQSKFSNIHVHSEEKLVLKNILSILLQCSIRLGKPRTIPLSWLFGSGVVIIVKMWPKTSASNSVGLKKKCKKQFIVTLSADTDITKRNSMNEEWRIKEIFELHEGSNLFSD